jgi:hypothetical protein
MSEEESWTPSLALAMLSDAFMPAGRAALFPR